MAPDASVSTDAAQHSIPVPASRSRQVAWTASWILALATPFFGYLLPRFGSLLRTSAYTMYVGAAVALVVGISTLIVRPVRLALAIGIVLLVYAALAGSMGFVQCGLVGMDDLAPCY